MQPIKSTHSRPHEKDISFWIVRFKSEDYGRRRRRKEGRKEGKMGIVGIVCVYMYISRQAGLYACNIDVVLVGVDVTDTQVSKVPSSSSN